MTDTACGQRWRTGRHVGRTIYEQLSDGPSDDDTLIGVMDSPELAAEACRCHNAMLAGVAAVQAEFLAASEEVWREIDRLDAEPSGYHPARMSVELRQRERAAWNRYRDLLDATTAKGRSG